MVNQNKSYNRKIARQIKFHFVLVTAILFIQMESVKVVNNVMCYHVGYVSYKLFISDCNNKYSNWLVNNKINGLVL